jgi:hypothetical protein
MIKVVLWTVGVVGKSAAPVIHKHPHMELVGCYTMSADKAGKDVGELCGTDPFGVIATDDADAVLALKPDCVLYVPQFPDVDDMVRILEGGSNIVSTAYFINGRRFGAEGHARIAAAAAKGGTTIYGTGINPGLANILGLVATSACSDVQRITVLESVDATNYASPGTWEAMGIGRDPGDPSIPTFISQSTPSFHETVDMMADALGVTLDDRRFDVEFATATQDVDLGYMKIGKGKISCLRASWTGWVGGRCLIDLKIAWKLGYHSSPDWPIEHGYVVEIEGTPNIRCKYEPIGSSMFDPGLITAMPAVHAIPLVCAAAPGIVTADQLPMITAKGVVG